MALLLMEGFERYSAYTDFDDNSAWGVEAASNFTFTTGRNGSGQCIKTTGGLPSFIHVVPGGTAATFFVGFALKVDSLPATNVYLLTTNSTANDSEIYLQLTTSGIITISRGGITELGSISAITPGVWNYIVLQVLLSQTVGTVEVWKNGTKELDLTNQDTMYGSIASIGSFKFSTRGSDLWYYDDLYIGDSSGSDMTAQVGEVSIEMVLPNADGTTNNFTRVGGGTNNYEAVDDGTSTDGDTTYLYSSTATDKELFGCAALTGTIDTIYAVQVAARVRKEDAGNRLINLVARSNVTESNSGAVGMPDYYMWESAIFENDPNGGGAWTETSVNAAEFGLKIGT